jgi:hypothetical protein
LGISAHLVARKHVPNHFSRYFLPILFAAAGVHTQNQRLVLNFANTIISAFGALIGTSLTDKGLCKLPMNVSFVDPTFPKLVGAQCGSGVLLVVLGCLPL